MLLYVLRELREHVVRVERMLATLEEVKGVLVLVRRISCILIIGDKVGDGTVFDCVLTSRLSVERNIS